MIPTAAARWTPASRPPNLAADHTHVWRAPINPSAAELLRHRHTLTPEERARADSFRHEHHRNRFTACRSILRQLASLYTGTPPSLLTFLHAPHGKPSLAQHPNTFFNVSHSGPLALFAFCRADECGIDLERVNPRVAMRDIARRILAPGESALWDSLPEHERTHAFFSLWTAKEALLKASGAGLGIEPRLINTLDPLSTPPDSPVSPGRWTLFAFDPGPNFAAAVATPASAPHLTFLDFVPR